MQISIVVSPGVRATREDSLNLNDLSNSWIYRIIPRSVEEFLDQCCQGYRLRASYVDVWEKQPRLGLEADDLQQEIARWPNIDNRDENGNGFLAMNNSLNEVCHGFPIPPEEWASWFDTPINEIESKYRRWLALKGTSGGIR
jgi:hypothetical protein